MRAKTADTVIVKYADLATERERQLTTGRRSESTKRDFWCPICHSAIGQASCHHSCRQTFDLRVPSSSDVPVLLLNQPSNSDKPKLNRDGEGDAQSSPRHM